MPRNPAVRQDEVLTDKKPKIKSAVSFNGPDLTLNAIPCMGNKARGSSIDQYRKNGKGNEMRQLLNILMPRIAAM